MTEQLSFPEFEPPQDSQQRREVFTIGDIDPHGQEIKNDNQLEIAFTTQTARELGREALVRANLSEKQTEVNRRGIKLAKRALDETIDKPGN